MDFGSGGDGTQKLRGKLILTLILRPLLLWLGLLLLAMPGMAQLTDAGRAKVGLISERAVGVPGETVWLGLSFDMDPGWHIYWRNPGDAGIAPKLTWTDDSDIRASQVGVLSWPMPELLPIVDGEIMDYGYSGNVVLPFEVTLPDQAQNVVLAAAVADYLICENVCIPERARVEIKLNLGTFPEPDRSGARRISEALAQVPQRVEGPAHLTADGPYWVLSVVSTRLAGAVGDPVRLFPFGHDIVHAAGQPSERGPEGLRLRLTPAGNADPLPERFQGVLRVGDEAVEINAVPGPILPKTDGLSQPANGTETGILGLIFLALLGGLILNLMPCVLPVLSIKAIGFVHAAAGGRTADARAHGLWYTAGVLVAFLVLAAAVIAVRSVTGIAIWGFWFQDPRIVTALILLVYLIGLWLLGLIEMGASVQGLGSGLAGRQGRVGAFFTGGLAAVVGAPCTGPFLGAALGSVMIQPSQNVIMVLLAMGVGMTLPMLALSFLPGLQKRLPRPGPWMETLKQVFAFPMFLTAAWLLSVLGALSGYRSVAFVAAGAALIGFGLWAWRMSDRGAKAILLSVASLTSIVPVFMLLSITTLESGLMALSGAVVLVGLIILISRSPDRVARRCARALAVVAIVGGVLWPLVQANRVAAPADSAGQYSASYPTEAWSPERVDTLLAQGRPVFVDFTAEWCATCQANKIQTLSSLKVGRAFERAGVVFLVADYTRFDADIAAALVEHGRAGVPMYLWYAAGARQPVVLPEILSVGLVTGLVEGDPKT